MNMIYRRKKVERTIFRKLGFGHTFYNIPLEGQYYYVWRKVGRRHYDDGPETTGGTMMANPVADVSALNVVKVHPVWNAYTPGTET